MAEGGFYIRSAPKKYKMTEQQKLFIEVSRECGIHKGMSKKDMQEAMQYCIGPKLRSKSNK